MPRPRRTQRSLARNVVVFLLVSSIVVATLAAIWKFGIEEWLDPILPGEHAPDNLAERWEFVIVSTLLAMAAMILPSLRAYRVISEQLRANRLAAAVFNSAPQPIVVCDRSRRVIKVNAAFVDLSGWSAAEIVGQPVGVLKCELQDAPFYAAIGNSLDKTGAWSGEIWNRRRDDGSLYAVWLSITPVKDAEGNTSELVGVLSDITWRKQREEFALHQANHDPLTGLANRRQCTERLQQILAAASVGGEQVGLLFIDLDGFKQVNDSLGHNAGDELLKEVATRLALCARRGDLLARLAGDEFVMVLPELNGPAAAESIAQRCLERFASPFEIGGGEARIGASIGIAIFPDHAPDAQQLLEQADRAMYRAKHDGRQRYRIAASASESLQATPQADR